MADQVQYRFIRWHGILHVAEVVRHGDALVVFMAGSVTPIAVNNPNFRLLAHLDPDLADGVHGPRTVGDLIQKANEDLLGRIWMTFDIRVVKEAYGPGLVVQIREKDLWGNSFDFTRDRTSGEILTPVRAEDVAPAGLSFLLNEAVEKVARRFETRPAA